MPSMTLGPFALVGEHILSEANETRSREHIFIAPQLAVMKPGTILGAIAAGNQAVAAAGQAGNQAAIGTFAAAPTADAGVTAGRYQVILEEEAVDGGLFGVYGPDGVREGDVLVGQAYNGSVNFTLNDGATDFAIGDAFDITVSYAAGSGLYVPLDPAAINGAQNFGAVLWGRVPISTANRRAVGHVRDCEVNERKIILVNALSGPQLAAMKAQARALGVLFSGGR